MAKAAAEIEEQRRAREERLRQAEEEDARATAEAALLEAREAARKEEQACSKRAAEEEAERVKQRLEGELSKSRLELTRSGVQWSISMSPAELRRSKDVADAAFAESEEAARLAMFEVAKREEEARAKRLANEEERLRTQQEAIEKVAGRRRRQEAPFENLRASLWRRANEDEWQKLVEKEKPEHDLSSFAAQSQQSQSSPQRQHAAGAEPGVGGHKNIAGVVPSEESMLLQAPTPGPLNFSVDDPLAPPVGASFCFDGTAVRLLFEEEEKKEEPARK